MFAEIALLNQSRYTDQLYTYKIPEKFMGQVTLGARVIVPFGMGNKPFEGFVMNVSPKLNYPKAKSILDLPDQEIALSEKQIDLCNWLISDCYCTISEALQLLVPTGATFKRVKNIRILEPVPIMDLEDGLFIEKLKSINEKNKMSSLTEDEVKKLKSFIRKGLVVEDIEFQTTVKTQYDKRVRVLFDPKEVDKELIRIPKRSTKQHKIIEFMAIREDVPYSMLREAFKADSRTMRILEELELIEIYSIERYREPLQLKTDERDDFKALNYEQQTIFDALMDDFSEHESKVHMLHGITGSGKTEIYMHLTREIVNSGKQVILLVPEISLTPQIVKRFAERFGKRVAVLHSKLSLGERYDQWKRIKNGEYPIVVGARSAIFAPCQDIGLIIIDEEHEGAYKSDNAPRYYTHDVARYLAESHGAPILLGSATPSVESYYKSLKKQYTLHELNIRFNELPLPEVDIIDMRDELQSGNRSIISEALVGALSETINKKQQVMLFLNRKGFSTFVSCRECGYSLRCPNCEIALTFYKGKNYAECKYCNYTERVTEVCPECSSKYYRYFGAGTERIEEEIRNLFPEIRIGRLDSETTARKGELERILNEFENQEIDILIGTQMIAKGLDFPNVALVGVLSADILINLPDYKASERAFQLLTQVAGRTGRGTELGKVILQTYTPDHYSIMSAQEHDYLSFFKNEIQLRRAFLYPPYVEMATMVFSSEKEEDVINYSKKLYNRIGNKLKSQNIKFQLFGPGPAVYFKLKNKYRYQVMLKYKSPDIKAVKMTLNDECKKMHKETSQKGMTLSLDHKPISIV